MSIRKASIFSPAYADIQKLLTSKKYDEAIIQTTEKLRKQLNSEKSEPIAVGLDILKKICDKSQITINHSLKILPRLLDHENYWIKQDALHITEKLFRIAQPQQFEHIIEKCEAKLFDEDKNVREAAVSLIATMLEKSYAVFPDLYLVYARMFNDSSWKVRAEALEGALDFLSPDRSPPMDLIEAFTDNIDQLFHDSDEEIRGLATEVMKNLCYFMNPNNINKQLLHLLADADWEVKEKGIWIIGEIGHLHFEDHYPLFKQLISLFSDDIMIIQTKTVDAFVKIGEKIGVNLIKFFKPFIQDLENQPEKEDLEDGIAEAIIFITIHNMNILLPILINFLHDENKSVRDLTGKCLIKIYMEKPDGFEEVLLRMFQSLEPDNWRQRKKVVGLLGDLAYVLHIQSVAVWTAINLQKWQEKEQDLDVREEIKNSLDKIQNLFTNLDEEINEIEQKKIKFYDGLDSFHEMSRKLRLDAEKLIKSQKFNEAEILLEERGNEISEKLDEYEQILYKSDFKRFSVDVIQDFKDFKEEIYEHISDIKNVMFNQICDGRAEYLEVLQDEIQNIRNRIDVVKAEYNSVKDMESNLKDLSVEENPEQLEEFLDLISKIRKKIFTLEFDIGQTWLKNLEFKEFLKEITLYWVDHKIEIQQYLANIYQRFSMLQAEIHADDSDFSLLKQKITYDFLNNNLQNIILQAIQSQRDVLERFDSIVDPIYKELRKRRFKEARHLVDLTGNNLYSSIENYNREINKVYQDLDKISESVSTANEIRKYLDNWDHVKNELLEKIQNFKENIQEEIFLEEVKEYLKYMNPIPLGQLSKEFSIDVSNLKEKLFNLIQTHKIFAEMRNDNLYQPEQPQGEFLLNFYRKVEIIGTKITFSLRVYNPTKFFINDIGLIFLHPEFLKLIPDESDPTDIFIREFEPEAIRIVQWNFRIDKPIEKKYELKKWLLNVTYKNPFGILKTLQKEMEIIL